MKRLAYRSLDQGHFGVQNITLLAVSNVKFTITILVSAKVYCV